MSSPTLPRHPDSASFADLNKKRRKGATRLSCAECRRLKLRCDRNIPCGSCIKRGCGPICPDGSLTTGQGNRFVLASTQELHEKISELCMRTRELEDALRYSHSLVSHDRHPLLSEELLQIKAPLQREPATARNLAKAEVKEEEQSPDVVDAFGSLSISASGSAKYYGSIANSWYFLQNENSDDQEVENDRFSVLQNILPKDILFRSGAFPILPSGASAEIENARLRSLYWYLPQPDKANELISTYYRLAAFMYNPIGQEQLYEEVYPTFYNADLSYGSDDPLTAHRLSVMFMILAIGCLMDTSQPAYNIEAEKYHQLARAALFQSSLFDDPTISAVQALFLMTFYHFFADRHGTNSGTRWALMGVAVKIAQSIGLHRDPGRWGVDEKEAHRRRELFWELYTYDSWQCHTFGRPPSFYLAYVDCKLPYPADCADEYTFHSWKHRFTSECMSVVHDQSFNAKTPTYNTVHHLDRKLRAFPVPPILQVAGFGSDPHQGAFPESIALTLQRHVVLAIRETNLLYLHRSFFARAISDHPKDPLGSPYGASVIAAYRSAGSLVALMGNLHAQLKEPSERIWFLWTHMFSCSIVLGSVVTRCPSMSLAPSAYVQLNSACELFSHAARGFRAEKVLDVMSRLRDRAHTSLSEYRKGNMSPSRQLTGGSDISSPVDDNDELSTLGGKTRLVTKKENSLSPSLPSVMDRSPTSMNPVVPLPLGSGQSQPVHPYVVDYLRTFNPTPAPNSSMNVNTTSSYADSSYTMSPVQEHPGQYDMSNGYHQNSQDQMQSMELVAGTYPNYFPVYDYSTGGMNGYSPMQSTPILNGSQNGIQRLRDSPEANVFQSTWQDLVTQMGGGHQH